MANEVLQKSRSTITAQTNSSALDTDYDPTSGSYTGGTPTVIDNTYDGGSENSQGAEYLNLELNVTDAPTSAAWQLQNLDGTIVNDRAFADCSFSGTEVVLSGDDLAIFGAADSGTRVFAVQATYASDAGSGLPLNDEVKFKIQKLLSQVDET